MKLSRGPIIALATFALLGSINLVGCINTIRWLAALPQEATISTLPLFVKFSLAKLPIQLVVCIFGFVSILFANTQFARRAAIGTVVVLLLLHLAAWAVSDLPPSTSYYARYGFRILYTAWLALVLAVLVPNNSFKPTPLRGAA